MSMLDWAKREVELACKMERGEKHDANEDNWDYGCACYESALKAFESLCGDGHSGFSIGMTKAILDRLIDGKPLTPIEDTEDVWNLVGDGTFSEGVKEIYQCKRMYSLFKNIHDDGTVTYSDNNLCYAIDIHDSNNTYRSGLVNRIIEKMYPITMPYMPGKSIKVICEDCLVDPKNGDFDTVSMYYLIKETDKGPEKIRIDRFFREPEEGDEENKEFPGYIEISFNEFQDRLYQANDRIKNLKKEGEE